jgi:hypothetical protein
MEGRSKMAVTFKCPACQWVIRPMDMHVERGSGGGFECPNCAAWLRFSRGFQALTVGASLALTVAVLAASGIGARTLSGLLLSALVIFIPAAFAVNAVAMRVRPPRLEVSSRRGEPLELFGRKRR